MPEAKSKNVILLVVLIALVILVWARGLKAPAGKRGARKVVVKEETLIPWAEHKPSPPAQEARQKRRLIKSSFPDWGRNPFVLGAGGFSFAELRLTGIFWDEKAPYALINDVVVKAGDMVSGNQVVDITKESVVLRKGDKVIVLKIEIR